MPLSREIPLLLLVLASGLMPSLVPTAAARAQPAGSDRPLLRGTALGPLVPLPQGLAPRDTSRRPLVHVQIASMRGEPSSLVGVLIGFERAWITATRDRGEDGRTVAALASIGLGVRLVGPPIIDRERLLLHWTFDIESSAALQEWRRLSIGIRSPVILARRFEHVEVSGFVAPAVGFERVLLEECENDGPGDFCGDLELRPGVAHPRLLFAGGMSIRHRPSGLALQTGVQKQLLRLPATFAIGLSIAP